MRVCVCLSDLVENESLADVSPAGRGAEVVNQQEEEQHEGNASWGVDGVDEEHHDGTTDDAQYAGMPGEVTKRGPEREIRGMEVNLIVEVAENWKWINTRVEMPVCDIWKYLHEEEHSGKKDKKNKKLPF